MIKFKKLIAILTLITCACVFLSGCWDYREINSYTIVAGSGIDLNADKSYTATIEKLDWKTNSIKSDEKRQILSATGSTIFDAYRNILKFAGKPTFSSHSNTILISKNLAESGISALIDMYTRLESSRLTQNIVVINNGSVSNFFRQNNASEDIISFEIPDMLASNNRNGKSANSKLYQISNNLLSGKRSIFLPIIGFHDLNGKGEKTLAVVGTAIFSGEKMIGELDEQQTSSLLMLCGQTSNSTATITYNKREISFDLKKIKSKIIPIINGNNILYNIDIKMSADIGQINNTVELTPTQTAEIEKILESNFTNTSLSFLKLIQNDYKLDLLGLNDTAYRLCTQWWIKNNPNWNAIYPTIKVTPNFDISITGSHMLRRNITRRNTNA